MKASSSPAVPPPPPAKPLARIAVRDGRFVEKDSGRAFSPRGFNYIRLRPKWHGTFAPDLYDAARAQAMLEDLRRNGFNTVRVFIDPDGEKGIADLADGGLSRAYLANVLDFLGRARGQGVYVIPSLLFLPPCKSYNEIAGRGRGGFSAGNEMYLDDRFTRAKARYVADFVAAVKAADAGLLATVLAYELDNETHFLAAGTATQAPFSRGEGSYAGPGGKTYDLSREEDLQALADDAVVRWADACVAAAQAVDPDAMVSVNVFTFAAVGRPGPAALRSAKTSDRRFPARPLALARTRLAYIDIHFYPFDDKTLDRDLASIEWEKLRTACSDRGKPLIMGEFGAFKKPYPAPEAAAAAMKKHLDRILGLGFAGFLYWTYDTHEQPYLWHAREAPAIFDVLRSAGKPDSR